jgi:hypothetical protein
VRSIKPARTVAEYLLGLVPLACDHDDVAGACFFDGHPDRASAIRMHCDLVPLLSRQPRENLIDDVARAF